MAKSKLTFCLICAGRHAVFVGEKRIGTVDRWSVATGWKWRDMGTDSEWTGFFRTHLEAAEALKAHVTGETR